MDPDEARKAMVYTSYGSMKFGMERRKPLLNVSYGPGPVYETEK
jgi:hypothetical protein